MKRLFEGRGDEAKQTANSHTVGLEFQTFGSKILIFRCENQFRMPDWQVSFVLIMCKFKFGKRWRA